MARQYFVGTSGWHYDHWRDLYYPPKLSKSRWLEFYARDFGTVELNNSFYRQPSERAFESWREGSPEGFVFAVKANRFITHIRKLREVAQAVETFVSRARLLGPKLGPILYQLPPNLHRDDARLEQFLAVLPSSYRHVVEFRHASWMVPPVFELLRRFGAAFCAFDLVGLECPLVTTADFAYFRFHGPAGKYWGSYSDSELRDWAARFASLGPEIRAVYVYFNNDAEAAAVANARTLATLLSGR